MTFATETDATHLQWRLGGQQGICSGSVSGEVPAVAAQQTDTYTHKRRASQYLLRSLKWRRR